jgi:hypothetical protein
MEYQKLVESIADELLKETFLQQYKQGNISADEIHQAKAMRDIASGMAGYQINVYSTKKPYSVGATPGALGKMNSDPVVRITDKLISIFGTKSMKRDLVHLTKPSVLIGKDSANTEKGLFPILGHELGHHVIASQEPDKEPVKMAGRAALFHRGTKLAKSLDREAGLELIKDESKSWGEGRRLMQDVGADTTPFADKARDSLQSYIYGGGYRKPPSLFQQIFGK